MKPGMKKHNFFAGPAILPEEVKKKTSESLIDFAGMGLSVMEISHRSTQWVECMNNAFSLTKELLNIPDGYEVLFLTGGASSQFYMSAMNLLGSNEKAGYINTGTWSNKAIPEAALFGSVEEIASSKDDNYKYVPKKMRDEDVKYVHYTSNNTVFGTQFHKLPDVSKSLVADMSSDIFSKPVDISRHDLIYCGAQKNMGPAGVTLVIVKKDVLGKTDRTIPTMLDYRTHIKKESMFNTPPVLPIYVSMLTMQWVKERGGVKAMEKRNKAKAELLYNEIERNELFHGFVASEDRSLMNACFGLNDDSLKDVFLSMADEAGICGIQGHRSVGGFRASMYNAMSIDSVKVLVDTMQAFGQKYG